jgi:hypothetical protein
MTQGPQVGPNAMPPGPRPSARPRVPLS